LAIETVKAALVTGPLCFSSISQVGPIGNDYHNLITTDGNYEVQLAMLSTKARVKLFKPYRNHGIISF